MTPSPLSGHAAGAKGLLLLASLLLGVCLLASLALGAASIGFGEVMGALFSFEGSREQLIVRSQRVPRTLIAAAVGASLGIAGSVIQGFTRNPLAEPGILGLNAGAALAVVTATTVLEGASSTTYAVFAFAGAGFAGTAVVFLSSLGRGGVASVKLVLAGTAMTALLASLTTATLIQSQSTLADVRFWLAGSVAGRDLSVLADVAPYMAFGGVLGLGLARPLTTLALGEDLARGVGQSIVLVKGTALFAVVLLAGASVAVAGPIAFVGLIVPNGVRLLVGTDYRLIISCSAILGAALVLGADVVSRLVFRPAEIPVGVTIAVIGGPVLIYIVQQGRRWA